MELMDWIKGVAAIAGITAASITVLNYRQGRVKLEVTFGGVQPGENTFAINDAFFEDPMWQVDVTVKNCGGSPAQIEKVGMSGAYAQARFCHGSEW